MDQEFSKRGPSHGSGTKQNEANSEAKCEISVYTCAINFLRFPVQNLGYNEHRREQSLYSIFVQTHN